MAGFEVITIGDGGGTIGRFCGDNRGLRCLQQWKADSRITFGQWKN